MKGVSDQALPRGKDFLSRSFSCYNEGEMDKDKDTQVLGKAWDRPDSVLAEYWFTWNPLLAEIEALDACQWLKEAGFPQYAQIYREGRFPIDIEMARRDHSFLDDDSLQAVFRRLKLLNKCAESNKQQQLTANSSTAAAAECTADQQLKQLKLTNQLVESEEDDDFSRAALTNTWTYKRNSRQWCRLESPTWETHTENSQTEKNPTRNSPFENSNSRNFPEWNFPKENSAVIQKNDNVILKKGGSNLTGNKSCNLICGDLLFVSSSSKDSLLADDSSSPASSRSDGRERSLQISSTPIEKSAGGINSTVNSEDCVGNEILLSVRNGKTQHDTKSHTKSWQVGQENKTDGKLYEEDCLGPEDLEKFIQSEVLACAGKEKQTVLNISRGKSGDNLASNNGNYQADWKNDETEDIASKSLDRNTFHIRSKSATVTRGNGQKIQEIPSPGVSSSRSPPCNDDNISDKLPNLQPNKPQEQPFQRNTAITSSGRLKLALMKKLESLSGKKKRSSTQLKSEDIGEPSVVESRTLHDKLEKLGCKDLSPSVSSDTKFSYTADQISSASSKDDVSLLDSSSGRMVASPITPNLTRSMPSTPSMDDLDEVLERLRVCEEAFSTKSSNCGKMSESIKSDSIRKESVKKEYLRNDSSLQYSNKESSSMSSPITHDSTSSMNGRNNTCNSNTSRTDFKSTNSPMSQSTSNDSNVKNNFITSEPTKVASNRNFSSINKSSESDSSKSVFCRSDSLSNGSSVILNERQTHQQEEPGISRAYDNIYRSSRRYNDKDRTRFVNSANTVSSERKDDSGHQNVEHLNGSNTCSNIGVGKQDTVALKNEENGGKTTTEIKSLSQSSTVPNLYGNMRGNFENKSVPAVEVKKKNFSGLDAKDKSQIYSPDAKSYNYSEDAKSHIYSPDAKSQVYSTDGVDSCKTRLHVSHSQPATLSAAAQCSNATSELDDILNQLIQNIDSLTSIRSKSLEPETTAEKYEQSCHSLSREKQSSSKGQIKSSESACSGDMAQREKFFEGSLRKVKLFKSTEAKEIVGKKVQIKDYKTDYKQNAENSELKDTTKQNPTDFSNSSTEINKRNQMQQLKLSISETKERLELGNFGPGFPERDSLTENSEGTSQDEDSQEGLESPVWNLPQKLNPEVGDCKDDWIYADDPRIAERRDSGIGSPLAKGKRQQRRARIRWHSFARSHRVSMSSQSRHLSSLSAGQLIVLRKLSVLKLTAALEKYSGLHLSSKNWLAPSQNKKLKSAELAALSLRVFGLPLTLVQQRCGQPLPECMLRAMRQLRRTAHCAEGIFRKSGVKSRVQALRDSVEQNPDGVDFSDHSPYDVADLIKLYFRELPDCLLTNKLSAIFIAIFMSNVPEDIRVDLLSSAVLLLPDENRETLACLLLFLNDMATHSQQNQMNASNLAICFAPAVFNLYALKGATSRKGRNRSLSPSGSSSSRGHRGSSRGQKGGEGGLPGERDLLEQKSAHQCLTCLINNAKNIFMVSEELIGGGQLTYIEQGDPVSLSELCSKHDGNLVTYIDACIQGLLKESRDKFKGWVTVPCSSLADFSAIKEAEIELKYKKVGDGHPLRLWKWQVEVEAPPARVLERVLRERHLWDPDLIRWRVVATLDDHTEVFQYAVATMAPHPARDFCELRSWRSDLPGGACVVVCSSVEHSEASLSEGGVRGVVLASRYLIEKCGGGQGAPVKSRVTHISRVDLRGHSLEWYNTVYSHICANQALALRDSFLTNHTAPESVVLRTFQTHI